MRRGLLELGVAAGAPARARTGRARRTEERVGFVDEREVGVGPRDRGDVGTALAEQERLLVVGEHAAPTPSGSRAANPNRSRTSSVPLRTGHMRSSAARTSGRRRTRVDELVLPLGRGGLTAGEPGGDGGVGDGGRRAVGGELELLRLGVEAGAVGAVRAHERAPVLAPEVVEHEPGDVGAPLVVRAAARVRALDDARRSRAGAGAARSRRG